MENGGTTTKSIEEKSVSKSVRLPQSLWDEIERRAPERARSAFIRQAIERELDARSESEPAKSIWEKIEHIAYSIPEEVVARLPTDGSKNVDHYLYGAPKGDE